MSSREHEVQPNLKLAATCGLGISSNTTSDNPQQTTKLDTPDMGLDGAELSCPGSSVVADCEDNDGGVN